MLCVSESSFSNFDASHVTTSSAFSILGVMTDLDEIRRVYDMVDENADGTVSFGEICCFLGKLGMQMSEEDLRCMLQSGTQPHEEDCSCLRFEEFVGLYHSIFSHDQDDKEEDDLMEAFKVFDQNNDGYISSTELQQVLSTMGLIPQGHDPQRCEKMICKFDSDSNGVLDFSEFKNMMSSKLSP
ncbi:hypothetical protein KI387_043987 [Taxus chinensis]|uniref:EF-hand domain-containing protein n=1 Tax=Taxus chinensis TaxID=29808 RepID=A0AA38C8P7_TAXCH|nr:hypothetical protein KI387_042309 [Taxus chinensis]KAH9316749.1 hypothetical protein KI387_043987 [Taxus chinensis]